MARPKKKPTQKLALQVVPPSAKQTQDVLFHLRTGKFLLHAAILAGVKERVLNKWLELGRKNVPGYVEFTDVIDRADAELGEKLMAGIMSFVEEGDLNAIKYLYEKRLGAKEKHLQAKWLEEADEAEEALDEDTDVVSLEDAEKQLEELLLGSGGDLQ
jgi:hypothetical protein